MTNWHELFKNSQHTGPGWAPPVGGGPTSYGQAALDDEVDAMQNELAGSRNDRLNEAALKLGQLVAGNHLLGQTVVDRLTEAARAAGLGEREISATIKSGMSKGVTQPRQAPAGDQQSRQSRQSAQVSSDGGEAGKTVPVATLRRADELSVGAPTTWLARSTLPRAAVAVLVGEEGIGKSLWWVLVAAHLTTGLPSALLGIPAREPADVVLVLTEDSWPDVRARLELAGADLDRIHVISAETDGSGSPTFPNDFVHVIEELRDLRPALLVVDAWLDTVAGELQVKDTQQARQALHPWKEMATSTGSTVLLLGHTNRLDTGDLRSMIGATAALRQKARVLLFAIAGPPDIGGMFVGPDKSNHSGRSDAVKFELEVHKVRPVTDDDPGTVARLRASGSAGSTIRELFTLWKKVEREAAKPPAADAQVEAWARENVTHGMSVELAQKNVRAAGHNSKRLTPAIQRLGGKAVPSSAGGSWVYDLPDQRSLQQSFQPPARHWEAGETGETGETPGQEQP